MLCGKKHFDVVAYFDDDCVMDPLLEVKVPELCFGESGVEAVKADGLLYIVAVNMVAPIPVKIVWKCITFVNT